MLSAAARMPGIAPRQTRIDDFMPRIDAVSRSPFRLSSAGYIAGIALALPAASAATVEVQVRDSSGAPVADAVVYAMASSGPSEAKPGHTVAVEQVDREFIPYVSVVQTGTAVAFPNRDPIMHHVYSFSAPKPFEIKLYTGKSPSEIVFDKAGIVTLGCNIHDWMIGYIAVVNGTEQNDCMPSSCSIGVNLGKRVSLNTSVTTNDS